MVLNYAELHDLISFFKNKVVFYFLLMTSLYLFLYSPPNRLDNWQKVKARGYLSWVTRPSPLTYYESLDGIVGLEYDILNQFCVQNKIELRVLTSHSNEDLFALLSAHKVDVAGANLIATKKRLTQFLATIGYDETSTKLVSSLEKGKIKSLEKLSSLQGEVLAHTSYVGIAEDLIKKYQATIKVVENRGLYELLVSVVRGDIDYTLADSNILLVYQSYIPKIRIGTQLTQTSELIFLLPHADDLSVKMKLDDFIQQYKNEGKVESYKVIINGSLPRSKPTDTVQFFKNYKRRWGKVKDQMYDVAKKYNINPILLGAISYQESHWNAKAVSPTLVKGIMMLTKEVAKEQGVTDRLDLTQSLEGGARHFIKTLEKIPKRINESDRVKFALASYNIGFGNLEKARIMAQKEGKNPDEWHEVTFFLKKLNEISNVDGETAVKYVENIQVYKNLLQWKEQQ
ncbi:MAG: transporter substrate-binding domain-containing protein [Proteobacteria bacterium]|nr:transporter substrate-binding domain-containing protein [Pseudomonadota bacterium]